MNTHIRPDWPLILTALAAVVVAGCAGEPDEEVDPLLGTTWLAEDIDGGGVLDKVQSTITFDRPERMVGHGGCNRFFGTVSRTGDEIQIGPLGGTRMACTNEIMAQERRFLQALEEARSLVHEEKKKTLYMADANGANILTFRRLRK